MKSSKTQIQSTVKTIWNQFASQDSNNNDDINDLSDASALLLMSGLDGTFVHSFLDKKLSSEILSKIEEDVAVATDENDERVQVLEDDCESAQEQDKNNNPTFNATILDEKSASSSSGDSLIISKLYAAFFLMKSDENQKNLTSNVADSLFDFLFFARGGNNIEDDASVADPREILNSLRAHPYIKLDVRDERTEDEDNDEVAEFELHRNNNISLLKYFTKLVASIKFFKKILEYRVFDQNAKITGWWEDVDRALLFWIDLIFDTSSSQREHNAEGDDQDGLFKQFLFKLLAQQDEGNGFILLSPVVEMMHLFAVDIHNQMKSKSAHLASTSLPLARAIVTKRCLQLLWINFVIVNKNNNKNSDHNNNSIHSSIIKIMNLLSGCEDSNNNNSLKDFINSLATDFCTLAKSSSSSSSTGKTSSSIFFNPGTSSSLLRSKLIESKTFFYEVLRNEMDFGGLKAKTSENNNNNNHNENDERSIAQSFLRNKEKANKKLQKLKENYDFISDEDENENNDDESKKRQKEQDMMMMMMAGSNDSAMKMQIGVQKFIGKAPEHGFPGLEDLLSPLVSSSSATCGLMLLQSEISASDKNKNNYNNVDDSPSAVEKRKLLHQAQTLVDLTLFSQASQAINKSLLFYFASPSTSISTLDFTSGSKKILEFVVNFVESSISGIPLYSLSFISSASEENLKSGDFLQNLCESLKNNNSDDRPANAAEKDQEKLLETFKDKILIQKSSLGEAIAISLQTLAWLSNEIGQRGIPATSETSKDDNSNNVVNLPGFLIPPMNSLLQRCSEQSRFRVLASLLMLSPHDAITQTFLAAWRFCMEDDLRLLQVSNNNNHNSIIMRRDLRSPFLDGSLVLLVFASTVNEWVNTKQGTAMSTWLLFQFRKDSALSMLQLVSWLRSVDARLKKIVSNNNSSPLSSSSQLFDPQHNPNGEFDQKVLQVAEKEIVGTIRGKFEKEQEKNEKSKQKNQQNNATVALASGNNRIMGGSQDDLMMFQFENFLNMASLALKSFC